MHLRARLPWQPDYTIALLKKNRHEWVTDNWRHVPLTIFYWHDSKIAFYLLHRTPNKVQNTQQKLEVAFSYLKRNSKGFHIGSEVLPHVER